MSYLVISDLGGGDFICRFVDDELWKEIRSLDDQLGLLDFEYEDCVNYLVQPDENLVRPEKCPERRGKVLRTAYVQRYVLEILEGQEEQIGGIVVA